MQTDEATRLFRIRKTILQMLLDRGYVVTEKSMNMTLSDFKKQYGGGGESGIESKHVARKQMSLLTQFLDTPTKRIMVFFSENEKKLGSNDIIDYARHMHKSQVMNGIVVTRNGITRLGQQTISQLEEINRIEIFEENELLINITEHELVPKHYIITSAEKQRLLERYRIKEHQLPKILVSDPVARYLGMRRGDVVKIIRKSETAGKYVTYRIAI